MSRIGRKPIPIPEGVKVDVRADRVEVRGKQGELTQDLPPGIRAELRDGELYLLRPDDSPRSRAMHGLARALMANHVHGVATKFEKKLEIVGIGYRASVDGSSVALNLGYSHPIAYPIPDGVDVEVEKQTLITIRGIDKQKVGQVAANIRDLKRPDMYKGKGVRFVGEVVRQKVGKSGGK